MEDHFAMPTTLLNLYQGQWVEYKGAGGEIERGRIKSWRDNCAYVVYKCNDEWDRFQDFTGAITSLNDLHQPFLTIESLEKLKGALGCGILFDHRIEHQAVQWIAVRGYDYPDWAIYYGPLDWDLVKIRKQGAKMFTKNVIRELIPCTDGAYNKYRL